MTLGRRVKSLFKGLGTKRRFCRNWGCNFTKVFSWSLDRAMRACEAHRSRSFLVLFAKILLQYVSSLEHGFKHPFKENIGPQSWYPALPWLSLCEAPALTHLSQGTYRTPPSCGAPTSGRHGDRSPIGEHRKRRKRRSRKQCVRVGDFYYPVS